MSQKDIIRWIIDRMMAHDDSITEELALMVEREARAEWGGQRIEYISKTVRKDSQAKRADAQERARVELASGPQPDEVARRMGVSRATLYRLVKRDP